MFGRLRRLIAGWRQRGVVRIGTPDDVADDINRVLSLNPSRIPSGRQWRLIPSFLGPKERQWIRVFLATGILSAVVLAVALSSHHLTSVPKAGGSITIGLVGEPQFINPVLARDNSVDADLVKLLFRGVGKNSSTMQAVPDLASSITLSDDQKTYTIVLKDGLLWSDGEPLTAEDVLYTIDTIKDAEYNSPLRSLFATSTVEVKDPKTAVITLTKPLADFPFYLDIGLLPQHAWSDATPQTMPLAELNVKPITNGPYKFLSVTKDTTGSIKSMTFTRNKFYAGEAPFLNRVVVKYYADEASAVDALKHESIDLLAHVPMAEDQAAPKKFKRSSAVISQLTAVFFNQRKNPAFKVFEVRKALAMATDRASLIQSFLPNHADPIVGPVLPGYPSYLSDLTVPTYDPAGANVLLEQNGWKKNAKGIRQKGTTQLIFALTAPDDPVYLPIANRLAEAWRALGAGVEVKTIEPSQIQRSAIKPRQYEALIFGQIQDADGDLYPFWHSSQQLDPGYNLSVYYNKKVDQDLADARTATSLDQRISLYQDFQRVLTADIPAIFLYQDRDVTLSRTSVRGTPSDRMVTRSDLFLSLGSWYTKTSLAWR